MLPLRCLLILSGLNRGNTLRVDSDSLLIGLDDSEISVLIDQPVITQKQARIYVEDNLCFIENLGAANNLYVNQYRISSSKALKDGDIVLLGDNMKFQYLEFTEEVNSVMDSKVLLAYLFFIGLLVWRLGIGIVKTP